MWMGQWGMAFGQSGQGAVQNLSFDHNTTGFFLDSPHKLVACESCHTSGIFRGTPRTCATCHAGGGARAPGKSATHIPTMAACDSCHRAGATDWSERPAGFTQGGTGHPINPLLGVTASNCLTCHNGAFLGANALAMPATHIQTSAVCSTCHGTTSWTPATNPHTGVLPGTCANCHNGVNAPGKKVDHILTMTPCDTCHSNFIAFIPAQMNHAGLDGQCSTCHSGRFSSQGAQSKPVTHVTTAEQCDSCHKSTTSWSTAVNFVHAPSITIGGGGCTAANCHGSGLALGKPTNHVPTSAICDTCHTNFSSFKPAQMNHASTAAQCASCHNGSFVAVNALGRSGRHIPTTIQCDSCHTQGFVSWSPAVMSHVGLDRQCSSCHSGGYLPQNAQSKPSTHISTTAQCDTCHSSTSTWATGTFNHSAASPAVTGRCSSCHNGTNALGKPTNHIPTAAQCDSCHNTFAAFTSIAMSHTGTAGTCNSCHNGNFVFANAQAKTAVHIPTSAQCDTCHTGGFKTWSPAVMNHTGLGGQCSNCHGGGNVSQNAQAKPLTHVSTTRQCDSCHGSTSTWALVTYSHDATATGKCDTCHGSTALGKPVSHIPTGAQCDSCHNNYSSFRPAGMNHGATSGQACVACHGGAYKAVNALAKPPTHIQTTASCETCHGTSYLSWATVTFSHTPVVLQGKVCADCHNNVNALGKPSTHIPTSSSCETCHGTSYTAFKPSKMNHATATGDTCATCHGGAYTAQGALAKPATHIPVSGACDTCHKNSNFVTWVPSAMDHAGLTQCAACHTGTYISQNAQIKPATHLPTTAECSTCHNSTTTWATGTFNHAAANPAVTGRCSTCHNGATALTSNGSIGKPTTHIPTTAQCDTCHANFIAFKPAQMNHTGTNGQCATCHSGGYASMNAQTKPATHVSTSAQCDTCHSSTSAWTVVTFVHAPSAYGNCATCHNGTTALGKPNGHIPVGTQQCSSCHKNFNTFKPAQMSHVGMSGACSSCHNGTFVTQNALAKPVAHIPVTLECDTCHVNGFTNWAPPVMSHTGLTDCAGCHSGTYLAQNAQVKPATHQVTAAQCSSCHSSTTSWATHTQDHSVLNPVATGRCSTCHNGTIALGKPTNHIPSTAQCDSCHTNYLGFKPAQMSHTGTSGQCSTCHAGAYTAQNAQIKTATHIQTNQSCDTCHTTTAWRPTSFSHHGVTVGTCSTCHNGTSAKGRALSHIPTTAACDSCHKNYAAFAPAMMSHAGTASQCSTCHNGNYLLVNAQTKPATHVLTASQCDTCHSSTTTWATATYVHTATAIGTCSSCHGTTALSKPVNHIPTSAQCDTCHGNFTAFKPAQMNHAGTANKCTYCHSGSYVYANALAKPAAHIQVTEQCDSCHKNGFVSWSPSVMNHTLASVQGQGCSTCHSGAYLSQNAQMKPATHAVTVAQCSTCHTSTTTWATAVFNHTAAGVVTANVCSNCHDGLPGPSHGLGKSTNHIPTTAQCDTCHKNFVAFAPASMNHTGTAGACANCHSGAYTTLNAQVKPATHIPTAQSCDSCHSTIAWKPTTFAHTGVVAGSCATCHNGSNALGKNLSHIPTTVACDSCHKNYTAFAPAQMNHAGMTGQCLTCHTGAYVSVNAQTKSATHVSTTAQCDTCHKSTTVWTGATYAHPATAIGTCSNCHNGTTAPGKLLAHIPTTRQCDSCHKNYVAFKPAQMDHSIGAIGQCSSCHGGAYLSVNALAKPGGVGHIPTTAQCDTCHKNYTLFAPATMSHTGTTGQCLNCHTGGYTAQNAQVKSATHIVTAQSCDACHLTTAWTPTSFAHTAIQLSGKTCATCHNGTAAAGKPAFHIPTTQSCDVCHRTGIAWLPLITPYAHTGVGVGTCTSCHVISYPEMDYKPANHLPTTASCDACHNKIAWVGTYTFNHIGAVACQTCHDARYTGVVAKPSNHIPTTVAGLPGNECSNCHTSTTSFATEKMNHGPATPSGLICKTCHLSGTTFLGSMDKKSLTHDSKTTKATDCSFSGCHKPLGSKGKLFTSWN